MNNNPKSDVLAKTVFKKRLEAKGYNNVRITKSPADIQADKDGKHYYFEIKLTTKEVNYFGAATLTEWKCAIENPKTFYFVIAIKKGNKWFFTKYSCDEFMQFSNIPPFKIYFNIPDSLKKSTKRKQQTKSISLTHKRLEKMNKLYNWFRKNG